MSRFLPLVSCCAVLLLFGAGCAWGGKKNKARSSAHIYEGDAPSIRMTDEQSAGGELRPYR